MCKKWFSFIMIFLVIQGIILFIASTLNVTNATSNKLRYTPPALTNPITIRINNMNCNKILPTQNADYIIVLEEKINASGGLILDCNGARNVVLIGGEIDVPWAGPWDPNSKSTPQSRRGLYIKNWTGVFHLEGVWIHGTDLGEGIDVDQRVVGGALQVQNIRVDGLSGRHEEKEVDYNGVLHPDIIQNWAGPTYYYIDYLTGTTDYQAFMMQPLQFGENKTKFVRWSHVNIKKTSDCGYQVYRSQTGTDMMDISDNVWLDGSYGNNTIALWTQPDLKPDIKYPNQPWNVLNIGTIPPDGDFVTAGSGGLGIAGMGYVTPGYNDLENTDTKLYSDKYTIDRNQALITKIPLEDLEIDTFRQHLMTSPKSNFEIYKNDGSTIAVGNLRVGYKVKVTAADGINSKIYTIPEESCFYVDDFSQYVDYACQKNVLGSARGADAWKITDDDPNTSWRTESYNATTGVNDYFIIDLGSSTNGPVTFDTLRWIDWAGKDYFLNYNISFTNDPNAMITPSSTSILWTTLHQATDENDKTDTSGTGNVANGTQKVKIVEVDTVTARYIRLRVTNRTRLDSGNAAHYNYIGSFEVYNIQKSAIVGNQPEGLAIIIEKENSGIYLDITGQSLQEGLIRCSVDMGHISEVESAILIMGLYEGDKLIKCSYSAPISLSTSGTSASLVAQMNIPSVTPEMYLKVFIWDTIDARTPYKEATIISSNL